MLIYRLFVSTHSRPHQGLKEEQKGRKDRIDIHRQPDQVQASLLEIHVHTCYG